jgi:hypothetical protein
LGGLAFWRDTFAAHLYHFLIGRLHAHCGRDPDDVLVALIGRRLRFRLGETLKKEQQGFVKTEQQGRF